MTKLSDAYRELADSFLRAAAAIDEATGDDLPDIPTVVGMVPLPQNVTPEQVSRLQPLPQQKPQVYVPPQQEFHGNAATTCPIHGVEYRRGNYGPYCAEHGTEPWADRKGFCSMPGRNNANALEYVKLQAAARK